MKEKNKLTLLIKKIIKEEVKRLHEDDYYGVKSNKKDHLKIITDIVTKSMNEQVGEDEYWLDIRNGGKDIRINMKTKKSDASKPKVVSRPKTPAEIEKARKSMTQDWRETGEQIIQELAIAGYEGFEISSVGPNVVDLETEETFI